MFPACAVSGSNLVNTMKITWLLNSALPIAMLFSAGCASIVDGGDKSVRIHSNPAGAKVTISDKEGKQVCVQNTPAVVSLKRHHGYFNGEKYTLSFEAPGYYPSSVEVKSVLNGWYFGNLFFGGAVGLLGVDPATGAMWTLSPREIERNLVSKDKVLTEAELQAAEKEANTTKNAPNKGGTKD